jgi:hypothetical protein
MQDEVEKKVMSEKLKRIEMDIEFKDKQLVELKELNDNENY